MEIAAAYEMYNALMKLQKKYADYVGNAACLPALDGDIGRVTAKAGGDGFAVRMAGILREWVEGKISGPPKGTAVEFYTDLWLSLHRKYAEAEQDDVFWRRFMDDAERLDRKYGGCRQMQRYALEIANELETENEGD